MIYPFICKRLVPLHITVLHFPVCLQGVSSAIVARRSETAATTAAHKRPDVARRDRRVQDARRRVSSASTASRNARVGEGHRFMARCQRIRCLPMANDHRFHSMHRVALCKISPCYRPHSINCSIQTMHSCSMRQTHFLPPMEWATPLTALWRTSRTFRGRRRTHHPKILSSQIRHRIQERTRRPCRQSRVHNLKIRRPRRMPQPSRSRGNHPSRARRSLIHIHASLLSSLNNDNDNHNTIKEKIV